MMLKKILSIVLTIAVMTGVLAVGSVSAGAAESEDAALGVQAELGEVSAEEDIADVSAEEEIADVSSDFTYGSWSAWSTTPVAATDTRQVETRQVIASYDLEGNCCGNSKGVRCYLKYMQSGYTLRLHYDRMTRSKAEVDGWEQWAEGSYYTYASNVNGYIIGPGTAYIEPYNHVPYFIVGTNYETQYRYREIYTKIQSYTVTLSPSTYIYTGAECKPAVTVKYGIKTLVKGTDYTVTYSNNRNVGTATATITGKGHYTGTVTKNYTIVSGNSDLAAPQITGFDSLDSGVKITWRAVSGAERYRAFYKGKNGWTAMGDTTSTSFIDTDVGSGKTYTYSVRCVSADGSTYTSEMDTTGWKYTYNMATPQITEIKSTDKGVNITWGKVKNASRYRVYYKNKNGNWVKMAEITGTSYLDTDVKWGGNYTYTVRCVNSSGRFTSDCSTTGWKHKHYLTEPKITKMTSSSGGVLIRWDPVEYAERYRIYYKNKKGNWVKMAEVTVASYLDTDVSYGNTYTYTVRCVNSKGEFTSDCSTKGWKHTHYLESPKITGFSSVGRGVKIAWNDVGASKYRVYYYGSKGWTRMGEVSGTSFIDEDVRKGVTYRYTVRCVNSSGKFTSDCDSVGWKYKYDPKLSAPSIYATNNGQSGVRIYWSTVTDAYKYRVYYKNSNGNWVKMGDTTGTSYYDTAVSHGSTYTYAVRCLAAKDDEFASGYSNEKSHTWRGTVTNVNVTSTSSGVRVTWSAVKGCKKYRIYRRVNYGSYSFYAYAATNSYLDRNVYCGKTYCYKVECV